MNEQLNNQALQKLKRVVIKEEFVALTGDITKAIILNQFIYWSERVYDFDKFIIEEKTRAEIEGEEVSITLNNGWIYKSAEELSEETMLNLAHNTMRRHIKYLVDNGWLDQRSNPDRRWDRTTQYRVNLIKINSDLMKIGYVLQDYKIQLPFLPVEDAMSKMDNRMYTTDNAVSKMYNGNSKLDNAMYNLDTRTLQNGQAIPEITTETTTEITSEITDNKPPSVHPSAYTNSTNFEEKNSEAENGLTDGITHTYNKQKAGKEKQEPADLELIKRICNNTGASAEQVRKAIQRANWMEKEGKVKSNYLKLVESIALTILEEDLVKNSSDSEEKKKKKDFISSLYMG